MGLKSNLIVVVYSQEVCATIAIAYLVGGTPLLTESFEVGLVFTFLLWYLAEYLPVATMMHVRVKTSYRHRLNFPKLCDLCRCCFQKAIGPCFQCTVSNLCTGNSLCCLGNHLTNNPIRCNPIPVQEVSFCDKRCPAAAFAPIMFHDFNQISFTYVYNLGSLYCIRFPFYYSKGL